MGSTEKEPCMPPTATAEEDDLALPRESINNMINDLVPSVRVGFHSREILLNCCTEFIHLISTEANDVCNQSNNTTMSAEHVLTALDRLGLNDYTVEAEAVLKDCKAMAAEQKRQSISNPEEKQKQQGLLAKARKEQAKKVQQQSHIRVVQSYIPPPGH